ncbi:hypothetical protein A3Q56_02144 [Intoshia linei]|uniref:Uncharacterized protein n=1 Tax=Intoshia linei TaxID=1819745 RepID=A0A177B9H3_9BILA|nr:hypothetical protein A3Q56_02144 [Intoshia linei]
MRLDTIFYVVVYTFPILLNCEKLSNAKDVKIYNIKQGFIFTQRTKNEINLNIFCFEGVNKNVSQLWTTFKLNCNFKDDFKIFENSNESAVYDMYHSSLSSFFNINIFKKNNIIMKPHSKWCVGVVAFESYQCGFKTIHIDLYLFISFVIGLVLLVYSAHLSRRPSKMPIKTFLTFDEYQMEAEEKTKEELEKLRQHCKDMKINSWDIIGKINDPKALMTDRKPHLSEGNIQRVFMMRLNNNHEIVGKCFSDEKSLSFDGPDGYAFYWHDVRKESLEKHKRQSRGGIIMKEWDSISPDTLKKLVDSLNGRIFKLRFASFVTGDSHISEEEYLNYSSYQFYSSDCEDNSENTTYSSNDYPHSNQNL